MSRIGWYAQRLKAMGAQEIGWRAVTVARTAASELAARPPLTEEALLGTGYGRDWQGLLERFRAGTGRPVLLDADRARVLAARHPSEVADVVAAAERVAEHRFAFFGHPEMQLPGQIDWHHDLATGTQWPAIPASRIDHRTYGGDAKWVWELNRLQHLPLLAQAWLLTGDEHFADAALGQLDAWLEQNPPEIGIAWRGAFEAGIRAMSVSIALQGLRDAPGLTPELFGRAVLMLAESARRCWSDRSRFSSANNHLVGELGGLLTVALMFPELTPSPAWKRRGLEALVAEHQQILPDGAGAEQSIGYQLYTADVFCLVIALLRARGDVVPPELVAALQRSSHYLAELVGNAEQVPRYGDDDGGFAVRLDATEVREVPAHLRTAAAILREPARVSPASDLASEWLADPPETTDEVPQAGSFYAPHGGLVILRSKGRRTTMDVGPLGYLSIAAHGHADALALTLMVDGRELITDPGTGSYYGHKDWRDEHRSTPLHATVCVDDLDQSVAGGMFLWSRHAGVTVRHVDVAAGIVCAEHDGYQRLDQPVTHRRWLWSPPDEDVTVVLDVMEGEGSHTASTSWPLHPDVRVDATVDGHIAYLNGRLALQITTACTRATTSYAVRGEPGPTHTGPGGWWSDRLERRFPAWRVGNRCTTDGTAVFATLLTDLRERSAGPTGLAVAIVGGDAEVSWHEDGVTRRLRLDLAGRRAPGPITKS